MSSSALVDRPARLRLRLTAVAESIIRKGHPWVFADSIREQNRPGVLGELGVAYDRHDRFLAVGLFDPESPIRLRVLHRGKPAALDATWWTNHLRTALAARAGMFSAATTGYRVINGESDGWPGLVLDRYGTVYVLKIYTAAWLPRLREVSHLIQENILLSHLVLRLSRNIQDSARSSFAREDGEILIGIALDDHPVFEENGLRFEAAVRHGQKTGFFLDQRENRQRVEQLSLGREVLNVFSFSGGFSIYAARGGARAVTEVDISPHALASAERNYALNIAVPALGVCRREAVQADAFAWLESRSARSFDLVIMDPPSLARREAERAVAIRAYANLARMGACCLRPGGILVAASCSAHVTPDEFFAAVKGGVGGGFVEMETTGHPADHPATFAEAHYLKCIYLRAPLTTKP